MKNKNTLSILVIFIGILFVTLGIYRKECTTIMIKATTICLECIGIG